MAGGFEIEQVVLEFTDKQNRNRTLKPVVEVIKKNPKEVRYLVELNHNQFWNLPNPHPDVVAAKDDLDEIFNVNNPNNFQNTSTGCSHGCNGWDDSELPDHKTDENKESKPKAKNLKRRYFNSKDKNKAKAIIKEKITSFVGKNVTVTWCKRPMKDKSALISVEEVLTEPAGEALFAKLKEWNFDNSKKNTFKSKVQALFTIYKLAEDTRGKKKESTDSERKYRFILKLYDPL
ncbi:hypothetical protein DdX_13600 [Ditylenchus destructor]|uniref:Uncharacterized protein n=1 Tax=Ditylenchus destructor TaxID=166010 RepID=A0AAD4MU84_9BILA|nr:hypothetical protein DdX_13600 [Ditylenchus destructor]